MDFRILYVGDVVGRPGRYILSQALPQLQRQHELDLVVVNAENIAGGSGMTPQLFDKLLKYGVDVVTLGDHVFKRKDLIPVLQNTDQIVRPLNMSPHAAGRGWTVYTSNGGVQVAVIVVLGRLYMQGADNPYIAVDKALQQIDPAVKVVLVEMHAEATSEKIAMGWHCDGRASCVVGTHTHVQTNDFRVLPKGTAYMTDLGMTGPYDSVLGRRTDRVLPSLITSMPHPYDVAEHDPWLCGALITVNRHTGRAKSIEAVRVTEQDIESPSPE